MQGSAIAEPRGLAPQLGNSGALSRAVDSSFLLRIFWCSGVFSIQGSRIDTIFEPLRSYIRYARSELCFIGFRDRLTLQTGQNVKNYRQKGLIGDPAGGPLPLGFG